MSQTTQTSHDRRPPSTASRRFIGAIAGLTCLVVLSGCPPDERRSCQTDDDCFKYEYCSDGTCETLSAPDADHPDSGEDAVSKPTDAASDTDLDATGDADDDESADGSDTADDTETPDGSEDARDASDGGTEPSAVDLLWVLDNSAATCHQNQLLRENFDRVIDELEASETDFHLAVTTTHFSRDGAINFENVAEGGHLQSTPNPVPGPGPSCRFAPDSMGDPKDEDHTDGPDFQPLRNAIDQAIACAKEDYPDLKDPSYDRLVCATYGANPPGGVYDGDDPCEAAGTTKHDGRIFVNDLFPCGSNYDENKHDACPKSKLDETYRDIPKVLRTSDYRSDGTLDTEALERDFACMSFVGTRGNGFEQGLKAAVKAVDPSMTGGPVEEPQDALAPNHGFIRQDASFATVFVTDENDCSYGPNWQDYLDESHEQNGTRDQCGAKNCYFPTRNADDQSPLKGVQDLFETFKQNLAESKDVAPSAVEEAVAGEGDFRVTLASLDGGYEPYSGDPPETCDSSNAPGTYQPKRCGNQNGRFYTADRYHDFIRQSSDHYPDAESGLGDRDNSPTDGLFCQSAPGDAIGTVAGELFDKP